jgi:hypothetical protein
MESGSAGGYDQHVKPFEEALAFYAKTGGDLMKDISAYSTLGGYVFITPHSLMFGKAVRTDGGKPDEQWGAVAPDAWYVRFAVGKNAVSEFISRIPYPLPYVGWSRISKDRPVNWFNFNTVQRRK